MKQWIIRGISMLLVGGILTGCAVQGQQNELQEENSQLEKKLEPKEEAETVFKIKETANIEGLEVTIKNASLKNGNKYIPPEKGKVLAVEFQVVNQREEQAYVGIEEFHLYDEDKNPLQSYFSYDDGFMKAELKKGETVNGVMYFDVPEKNKYELVYKPGLTDEKEIRFEVTLHKFMMRIDQQAGQGELDSPLARSGTDGVRFT